jgi:hypothetical protein
MRGHLNDFAVFYGEAEVPKEEEPQDTEEHSG